jgi:hypothetical protein
MGQPQTGRGTPPVPVCYQRIAFYSYQLEWDDHSRGVRTDLWKENLRQWKYWLERAIAVHQSHHPREPVPQNPYAVETATTGEANER